MGSPPPEPGPGVTAATAAAAAAADTGACDAPAPALDMVDDAVAMEDIMDARVPDAGGGKAR